MKTHTTYIHTLQTLLHQALTRTAIPAPNEYTKDAKSWRPDLEAMIETFATPPDLFASAHQALTCVTSYLERQKSVVERHTFWEEILTHQLERAQDLSENSAHHIYHCALMLADDKQYQNAQEVFQLLNFLDPMWENSWIGQGEMMRAQHQTAPSLFPFMIASSLNPQNPTPLLLMGQSFKELGCLHESHHFFTQALDIVRQQFPIDRKMEQTILTLLHQK